MRLFHGRQGTQGALGGELPGLSDPANPQRFADPRNPSTVAKARATQGNEANSVMGHGYVTPKFAAATMHNDLSDDERLLAQGGHNIPIHPAQVPSEGSDTQETEGDASVRDPTGIGRGT